MCKHFVSLVYRKRVGSALRKAVLGYMADRASEDGSGIWCSKGRIARETEFSESAVKKTVREFLAEGVLVETGKRKHENGETTIYSLVKVQIERMPDAAPTTTSGVTPTPSDPGTEKPRHPVTETPAPQNPPPRHPVPPNLPLNHLEPPKEDQSAPDPRFSEFWERWPLRRVVRKKAEVAFKRLSPADKREAINRVESWVKAWRASNPTANDIHPTTYLNGRRWEDDFSAPSLRQIQGGAQDGRVARWHRIAASGGSR